MKSRTSLILIIYLLLFASCKRTNEQLIQEAVRLTNKKNYKKAIDIYTTVITNNDKIELAYYNRGRCYYDIDQYDSALKDFNTILSDKPTSGIIITINPNSPAATEEDRTKVPYNDALYQRAIVKVYMDSIKSSYRDFQTLIDANYEKAFCTIWQGDIWHMIGNDEKACKFMQRARRLAISEEEIKEADKMIKEYCQAISRVP
jgi:tetratricopeptide (TPR) repeat protein